MFCTSCGNQLKEGQKFCSKCGAQTKAKASSAPISQTPDPIEQRKKREQEELKRKEEQEQRKKLEEEQARAEKLLAQAEKKRQEELKEKEEERRRQKALKERREHERKQPLPDAILLEIRTHLLASGGLSTSQLDDIKRKAQLQEVDEDRFNYNLEQEIANYGKKPENAGPKQKRRGWIFPLVIALVFLLLVGAGYVFRSNVLNQFDDWGMRTSSMREWLNVPVEEHNDDQTVLGEQSESDPESDTNIGQEEQPQLNAKPATEEFYEEPWETSEHNKNRDIEAEVRAAKEALNNARNTPSPKPKEPEFYTIVDRSPEFPGGNKALLDHVQKSINYPPSAKMSRVSGTVYVEYVVSTSGAVQQAFVVKGVHPLLDKEAVRVISSLKGFSAARKDGRNVPYKTTMPVRFVLN